MKFISKSNFRHFKLFSSYSTQLRMRIAECMRPISHGRPFQWHHSARLSTVNIWSEMSLLAAGKELTAVFILLVLSVVVYVRGKWEIKFRWTSAAHLIRLLMTSCFNQFYWPESEWQSRFHLKILFPWNNNFCSNKTQWRVLSIDCYK